MRINIVAKARGRRWHGTPVRPLALLACSRRYARIGIFNAGAPKPLFWIGSSLDAMRMFPEPVRDEFGFALYQAQLGGKHVSTKPMKGFGGAGVLEVVGDHRGDTYRAVYTVRFAGAVYVLHAFQKKSKSGIKTPKRELDLIEGRLKQARTHFEEWRREQENEENEESEHR